MTPDEVVKVLEEYHQVMVSANNLKLLTKKNSADKLIKSLSSAITQLQDYQKLREKIDADKIRGVMGINCESYPADEYKMANAIVTYLGGGE